MDYITAIITISYKTNKYLNKFYCITELCNSTTQGHREKKIIFASLEHFNNRFFDLDKFCLINNLETAELESTCSVH